LRDCANRDLYLVETGLSTPSLRPESIARTQDVTLVGTDR
jgi:hypothetical protein